MLVLITALHLFFGLANAQVPTDIAVSPGPELDVMAYLEPEQSQRRMVTTDSGETVLVGWMSWELTVTKWHSDGSLSWQHVVAPSDPVSVTRVVADGDGNFIVGGAKADRWWLIKLNGSTGELQWEHAPAQDRQGKVVDLVPMANGDIVALGYFEHFGAHRRRLARFEGASGAKRWEQLSPFGNLLDGTADQLAVDATGSLWMATTTGSGNQNLKLARVNAETGLEEISTSLIADPDRLLVPRSLLLGPTNHVALTYLSAVIGEPGTARLARYGTDLAPHWDIPLPDVPDAISINQQSEIAMSMREYSFQTSLTESTVMRIGPDGISDWIVVPFPALNRSQVINDVQIDADGRVCVIGDEGAQVPEGNSVFIACLNALNGSTDWVDYRRGTGVPGHIGTLTGQAGYLTLFGDELIATATLQNLTRDFIIERRNRGTGAVLAAGTDQPLAGMRESLADDLGKRSFAATPSGTRFVISELPDSVHSGYSLLHVQDSGEQIWRSERVQVDYGGGGTARRVVSDNVGNAIVIAWYRSASHQVGLIEKMSGLDGSLNWSIETGNVWLPTDIAAVEDDGVIVAGRDVSANWVIRKIDAAGQTLWSTLLPATGDADQLVELEVNAAGNAIVLGTRLGPGLLHHMEIVMLDGSDGQVLWGQQVQGPRDTRASDLLLHPTGDIIISGYDKERLGSAGQPLTARLSADSGAILWTSALPIATNNVKIHLAGDNHLIVAAWVDYVAQIELNAGLVDWTSSGYFWDGPVTDLTVDPEGDVIVISDFSRFAVVKFNGRDGQFQWATNPTFMGLSNFIAGAVASVSDHRLLLMGHATVDQLGRSRLVQIWLTNNLYADGFESAYAVP